MTSPSGRADRPPKGGRSLDAGQSSVEFALMLPAVMVLVLVLLQTVLVMRAHLLVVHASREAARAAAVSADPGSARSAAAAAGDLDPARLRVRTGGRASPGSRVTATVDYAAPTDVPLVGSVLPDVTVSAATTMRVE